ncbi:nuclear speckle RNA-binding protein A-like [Impatiens glandulifera]|uniref:nuclear speckle RNA-binding protein A-like n=1 Tax=Impatiens glandulifera TaxID=253017 RepID=UPI001FB14026|nr:nuclear speckle RNA-binding protein A-like [Impatiens glandulifera]
MADGFWNKQAPSHPSSGLLKRPRSSDYTSSAMNQHADQVTPRVINETNDIGSAYDRYLQNMQTSSFSSGEINRLSGGGQKATDVGLTGPTFTDSIPMTRPGIAGVSLASNGLALGFDAQIPLGVMSRSRLEALSFPLVESMPRSSQERLPLPPDATSTLYVEGLPSDCKKREVAHIFRPFVGYKEVRLVVKDSKHRDGEPLILCFVDFIDPACAATALSALQGYKMDEDDSDSSYLRIQFSKFPGPRSGTGNRGRR